MEANVKDRQKDTEEQAEIITGLLDKQRDKFIDEFKKSVVRRMSESGRKEEGLLAAALEEVGSLSVSAGGDDGSAAALKHSAVTSWLRKNGGGNEAELADFLKKELDPDGRLFFDGMGIGSENSRIFLNRNYTYGTNTIGLAVDDRRQKMVAFNASYHSVTVLDRNVIRSSKAMIREKARELLDAGYKECHIVTPGGHVDYGKISLDQLLSGSGKSKQNATGKSHGGSGIQDNDPAAGSSTRSGWKKAEDGTERAVRRVNIGKELSAEKERENVKMAAAERRPASPDRGL